MIRRGGNQTAIIFVHGLFGHYIQSWGPFLYLLLSDGDLNHCDILFWGYPSHLQGLMQRLPYVGHRLPSIPEVSIALKSALCNPEFAGTYQDIVLVGHSMGGIVIQKMILDCLVATEPDSLMLLEKIRSVVFYGTPLEGVHLKSIARIHRQLRGLQEHQKLVADVRREWVNRVYTVRAEDPPQPGKLYIPATPVFGLEDSAVPVRSAQSVYSTVEGVPGSHTEMCKPRDHQQEAYQILKREVLAHTWPIELLGHDKIVAANCRIVRRARDTIFTVGSRSRDEQYLKTIEEKLRENPGLAYWRILFGPPRSQALKEHLLRVLSFRSPADRSCGCQTIFLAMYNDDASEPEHNLCGNDNTCLIVQPPRNGVGQYSTAQICTKADAVRGYLELARELYGRGENLESCEKIKILPVLGRRAA